jgi:5'-nucleotidase
VYGWVEMEILITNDDGIYAEGLWALYRRFSTEHSVTVVAPDRERSAVGHGITLDRPLRASRVSIQNGFRGYAVTGTPADCVKLGLLEILKKQPDLVLSGINPGANVGININYSGTVAAAREAALNGIAAVAVSVRGRPSTRYDEAAVFVEHLAAQIAQKPLPVGTFLNVNIPDVPLGKMAGVRVSRQGIVLFSEYFEKRKDPRDRTYFWQGCDMQPETGDPDIDGTALGKNQISVTPIKCDMTDYNALETLKTWELSLSQGFGSRISGDLS